MAKITEPVRVIHVTSKYSAHNGGVKQVLRALLIAQNKRTDMKVWIYESQLNRLVDQKGTVTPAKAKDLLALCPDLVIFHLIYTHIPSYYKVTRALKEAGIPYLVEPHGGLDVRAQAKSNWKKRMVNALWADRWLKGAQAIVYLCGEERRYSRMPGLNEVMITNTFPTVVPILDEAPPSHRPVRLMMLGRIDIYHKGIDRFFATLKDLPQEATGNVEVVFYGFGSAKELAWLKGEIAAIDNVAIEFRGPIFGQEKAEAYKNADIFCMFSRYEGLPLTLYEAAASGLPLIVTEGSNRTEWVTENKNGWVFWDQDEANWGMQLMDVVWDYQQKAKAYRENALRSARKLPTWDQIAETSAELYREWGRKS